MSFNEARVLVRQAEHIIACTFDSTRRDAEGYAGWSKENMLKLAEIKIQLARAVIDSAYDMLLEAKE